MGVTYDTITDNITNLQNKHANFSFKFYLGCGPEVCPRSGTSTMKLCCSPKPRMTTEEDSPGYVSH